MRCSYCGKETINARPLTAGNEQEIIFCCSDDCADKAIGFYRYADRWKNFFIAGVVLTMTLIFSGVFVDMLTGSIVMMTTLMGAGIGLLGLGILFFPFATPETFALFGIKKTLLLTRLIALVFLLGGVIAMIWVRV